MLQIVKSEEEPDFKFSLHVNASENDIKASRYTWECSTCRKNIENGIMPYCDSCQPSVATMNPRYMKFMEDCEKMSHTWRVFAQHAVLSH